TRWPRDWSSDVCSSDLRAGEAETGRLLERLADRRLARLRGSVQSLAIHDRRDRAARVDHPHPMAVVLAHEDVAAAVDRETRRPQIGRASCRERGQLPEG